MHTPKFPDKDSMFEIGGKLISIVPTSKRIRAYSTDSLIADSNQPLILRVPRKPVTYCFSPKSVIKKNMELSGKGTDEYGEFESYNLRTTEGTVENIAKTYVSSPEVGGKLNGYTILDYEFIEKWMEEDEIIRGHPRDPYTRIDVLQSKTRVEYFIKGEKIVDANNILKLFETGLPTRYYIHPDDVNMDFLFPSESETFCPYKGKASYWDIRIGDKTLHDAVWSYLEPFDEVARTKGYFSFYEDVLDSILIGERKKEDTA